MNAHTPQSPLAELRSFLAESAIVLGARRLFGAVVRIRVAGDIVDDDEKIHRRIIASSFTAEQADLEAEKIIQSVIRDGVVTVDEIPRLKAALRNIHRSAERDHEISELARV